ncbi:MAG TPA: hypothetical protein VFZ46_04325 [Nitrososphaeraceae archaeon]
MNRFKIVLGRLLFIITITITTIPILVNEERLLWLKTKKKELHPLIPKNVTNQTLQGYPTEDKNMSTGIENK